jgi:hypothetical protein
MRKRLVVTLVVARCLVGAPAAQAESSSRPRDQARDAFERGVALVDQERWDEALRAFDESLRIYPTQTALFNRALCLGALSRPADAIRALEDHRRQYGSTVDAERRAEVEAELALQRQRAGRIGVEVHGAESATVLLDGAVVGQAPIRDPLTVNPGSHVVSARPAAGAAVTQTVSVAPGGTTSVVLAIGGGAVPPQTTAPVEASSDVAPPQTTAPVETSSDVAPPPPLADGPAPVAPTPRRPGRGLRIAGYVSAGLAVAALGATLGLYLWNDSEFERWRDEDRQIAADLSGDTAIPWSTFERRIADNDSLRGRIGDVDAATWALLAVGVVAAAAAATLLALGHSRRGGRSAAALLAPVPGGAALAASF